MGGGSMGFWVTEVWGVACATDNANVKRTQVLLVALLAGVALGGVGLAVDFTGYWNCDAWVQSCTVPTIWFAVVLVAPWLFATVLLARTRSISVFSCVDLATWLVLALCAWLVISTVLNLDRDYAGNDDIEEMIAVISIVGLFFFLVGLLATAVVGAILQFLLSKRWGTLSAKTGS